MEMKRLVATAAFLSIVAMPALAAAAEKGHGGMDGQGMHGQGMQGQGTQGAHDMMKMGTRVYLGKVGQWNGEVRMVDMKAQMAASGMATHGAMTNSHHIALALTDPTTKARITEGSGAVTVVGPDKSVKTYDITGMQGHFGADVNLPGPGKYRFNVKMESGGKDGAATFLYTLK